MLQERQFFFSGVYKGEFVKSYFFFAILELLMPNLLYNCLCWHIILFSCHSDQASAVAWLSDVKRNFEHKPGGVIRENITLTVAAILVGYKSKKIFTVALDAVSVICKYNSELVS